MPRGTTISRARMRLWHEQKSEIFYPGFGAEMDLLHRRGYSTGGFIAAAIGSPLDSGHVESRQPARCPRALWTVSADGRVVGSLVCRDGAWRLSWLNGANRRLVSYPGPVDGNVEASAEALLWLRRRCSGSPSLSEPAC